MIIMENTVDCFLISYKRGLISFESYIPVNLVFEAIGYSTWISWGFFHLLKNGDDNTHLTFLRQI